jgi:hypothetical protein
MQAQEYALAKWSVAQRCTGATAADIDRAIADGTILRTHVLRPTWHFVHRDDIRWLLDLSGPRVQAMAQYRHRQLGITTAIAQQSSAAFAAALEGGNHLTRRELAAVLQRSGIATEGQIIAHLVMNAELEAVICSGVPRGKEQTYALLDERAPDSTWLPRDEALAELTSRYFRSHGPATLKDFQWWSMLSAADARRGIRMAGDDLQSVDMGGRTYWLDPTLPVPRATSPVVQLVQQYDEFLVGYSESRCAADIAGRLPRGETLTRAIVLDGQMVGRWRRPAGRKDMEVELLRPLRKREQAALVRAVEDMVERHP